LVVRLLLYLLLVLLKQDGVEECRALSVLREKVYIAAKLVNDQLGNDETQSNSVGVDFFLLIFDGSEHFENLFLVFLLDSDTGVCDRNPDKVLSVLRLILHKYHDLATSIRKLYRVGENVDENLLNSLLIARNPVAAKVFKVERHFESLHRDLVLLNLNDLIDCIPYVESLNGLGEVFFLFVQNCVIQHVMHEIVNEF
jgi:hypothetical protein